MSHTKTLNPVELKRKYFRRGVVTGGVTVGVIAALLSSRDSCHGDAGPQDNYTDAGNLYMGDAGITDIIDDASTITAACPDGQSCYSDNQICKEGQDCYGVKYVDGLEGKLIDCLEDKNACIKERDELRKRPESCPKYTPKPCPTIKELPPVKECPKIPYIRKGD